MKQSRKLRKWYGCLPIVCVLCALLLAGCGEKSYLEQSGGENVGREADGSGTDAQAAGERTRGAETAEKSDGASPDGASGEPEILYVQVSGAVHRPGVYEMTPGSRIYQAIEMAGGLREDACARALNQARPVTDGQMIYVYTEEEAAAGVNITEAGDGTSSGGGSGGGDSDSGTSGGKINLNTADASELMTLPGIGEAKANLIIAYRTEHGKFSSPEDIMKIQGIKEGVYRKIADMVTV